MKLFINLQYTKTLAMITAMNETYQETDLDEQEQAVTINFVSLGCAKNLVDTEKMLGSLATAGFLLVGPDEYADATVINTCGFIEEARQEAIENIQDCIERKKQGLCGCIVVTGCYAQFVKEKLIEDMPEIDAVVGLAERDTIGQTIIQLIANPDTPLENPVQVADGEFRAIANDTGRLRITESPWTYLRISEGCNQNCTFCTIPSIRGPFRSKPIDDILEEAKELISDGVVELNLIGQETSSYGLDIGYAGRLGMLLRELNKLDGLQWIRVLYMHPASITDDIIDAMVDCDKVVPYLDIPLQHISDNILKLMNRKISKADTIALLDKLRSRISDISIRTTMLLGFPSETNQDFDELMEFLEQMRFEMLSGFMYSYEDATPSAKIEPKISDEVQIQRFDKMMLAQQDIAFQQEDAMQGKTLDCMITAAILPDEAEELELNIDSRWVSGRHPGQGPEVDSICYVSVPHDLEIKPGEILKIEITGRMDYDLIAKAL